MLSLQGILDLLNDKSYKEPLHIYNWRRIYYGMSLHIDGICPAYHNLRYENGQYVTDTTLGRVTPLGYGGAEYQYLFDNYLFNKHPREAEVTRQWRLSQYKPFTRDPFHKAIQVITGAIFQDSSYTLEIKDKEDNDYIWGNNFEEKSLVQFFISKFQDICSDPNGVFVIIPDKPAKETTGKPEPKIYFINSKFIKHHTQDEIIFCMGEIVWAVNSFGYFRFKKNEDNQKEYVNIDGTNGYYAHLLGYKPVIIAGGIWNAQGFYDSWLTAAKPIADEFVSSMSGEQMVMKDASHPFITVAATDCPDCQGAGTINKKCGCGDSCETCNGMPVLVSCKTCGGTGDMSHNPSQWQVVPADQMGNDLIKITNPDTAINKLHIERTDAIGKSILRALHLDYIDQAQSGVAKDKDMETRYQFLSNVSNDLFDRLLTRTIECIISLRHVRVVNGAIVPDTVDYLIVKPNQFQIKTAFELLQEYTEAEKSLPDFMLYQYLEALADKQFGGDEVLKKKTRAINYLDKLALKNDAGIQIIASNNFVRDRDIQFHYELPQILDNIIETKGSEWFVSADMKIIKAEVQTMFAQLSPIIPEVRPDVIDENRV